MRFLNVESTKKTPFFYNMVFLSPCPFLCMSIWTQRTPTAGIGDQAIFHDFFARQICCPCEIVLWRYLKYVVYPEPPHAISELNPQFPKAVASIDRETLINVYRKKETGSCIPMRENVVISNIFWTRKSYHLAINKHLRAFESNINIYNYSFQCSAIFYQHAVVSLRLSYESSCSLPWYIIYRQYQ